MQFNSSSSLIGRIVIGVVVTIFMLVIIALISVFKHKKMYKPWLLPNEFAINKVTNNKKTLLKTDYLIWLIICSGFLIWLVGAYLIVTIIQLSQFSQDIILASEHNGIKFIWNPEKVLSNGYIGGFDAVFADNSVLPISKGSSLMPFVMQQFDTTKTLFSLVSSTVLNKNSAFLVCPDQNDMWLMAINNQGWIDTTNVKYPLFYNNFYNNLSLENQKFINLISYNALHSLIYSAFLFTPLCQFLAFALPLSIILSYKKDYASIFAPWGLLGGIVVIFIGIVGNPNVNITYQFILYDEKLFFGYHLFLLLISLSWLFYSNRYRLKQIINSHLFILVYAIWVIFASNVFNVSYYTTGFTKLDFSSIGTYWIVYEIAPLPFPVISVVLFIFFLFLMNLFISIKNLIHTLYWKKQIKIYDDTFINEIKNIYNKSKIFSNNNQKNINQ